MSDNCYVLWIDILGFTDLVKEKSSKDILNIITRFLGCLEGIGSGDTLTSIYFSDSAIVWQKSPSKKGEDFLRFSAASVLMCSNLLANEIPCRGAIAYGPFIVERDISDKYDIFFGEALIEAYKAEANENWLGVTVCPSAAKYVESSIIDKYSGGHFLKRNDETLLLNPFLSIQRAYNSKPREDANSNLEWVKGPTNKLFLLLELLAFKFIFKNAKEFANNRDFSGRVASKYHTTISFLREVLPGGCFEWAQNMSNFVKMKYGEPKIVGGEPEVVNA